MFQGIQYIDIGIILVSIIVSMALHEAMHAFVAHRLGDSTALEEGRLTVNPLRHIDIITTVLLPLVFLLVGLPPLFIAKPVPLDPLRIKYDEYGVALVAIAGPMVNLALAAATAFVLKGTLGGGSELYYHILLRFIEVNIAFFVLNMMPIPPLDGSRLLYAFAPDSLRRVMMAIESAGFLGIMLVVLLILSVGGSQLLAMQEALFRFLLSW